MLKCGKVDRYSWQSIMNWIIESTHQHRYICKHDNKYFDVKEWIGVISFVWMHILELDNVALVKFRKLCFINADLSTCLSVYLPTNVHVRIEVCFYHAFNMFTCISVHLSTYHSCTCWNVYLLYCQSVDLSTCPPFYLSTMCMPNSKFAFTILFMCLSVDQGRFFVF